MEIFDLFGNEILCGSVISYPSDRKLKSGVVVAFEEHTRQIIIANMITTHRNTGKYETRKYIRPPAFGLFGIPTEYEILVPIKVRRVVFTTFKLKLDRGESQDRFIVIKDPLFNMNSNVVKQLDIIALGQETGVISKDYKLGDPSTFEYYGKSK